MANKNFSTLDEDAISFENFWPLNLAPGAGRQSLSVQLSKVRSSYSEENLHLPRTMKMRGEKSCSTLAILKFGLKKSAKRCRFYNPTFPPTWKLTNHRRVGPY